MLFYSCDSFHCRNKANIEVSEILHVSASNKKINYCSILRGAVNGDSDKLIEFLNIVIDGGASSYDHAAALVELVNYHGEKRFLELANAAPEETKKRTLYRLKTGLLFTPDAFGEMRTTVDLASEFPLIVKEWGEK